jgi:hypothetical protein
VLGRFEFNGGTLAVRTSSVANAQTFFVGDGVAAATLKLVGSGVHSFSNGLTIRSNAFLIGNGTISGAVAVLSGGTFAPGTSVGTITLSNSPALGGALLMEISRSGSVLTNDQIQVNASLTYGGILTISNIGPDTLAPGDRFNLFNATSYSGSFMTLILPALASGLSWTNQLLLDGSLQVIIASRPQFASASVSGTNVVFAGAGGISNGTFTVLTSTNLTLPITNWVPLLTNQFDATGNFLFTNSVNPALPQRFYMLRVP